jgi:tRNA 5-methylaminomethyl-2-thiouridine biosynthesis bifunctional protein
MWSKEIFTLIADHANHKATFSTYSVSKSVKLHALEAGFSIEEVKGFGTKKGMLKGNIKKENIYLKTKKIYPFPYISKENISEITIIGTGLAGLNVAYRLASHGIPSVLIDENSGPGENTSGNPLGYFGPKLSKFPSPASRLSLLGTYHTESMLMEWSNIFKCATGRNTGFYLVMSLDEQDKFVNSIVTHELSSDFFVKKNASLEWKNEKIQLSGIHVLKGGIFFPNKFSNLMVDYLKTQGCRFIWNTKISKIDKPSDWMLYDDLHKPIHKTKILILANSFSINQLAQTKFLPFQKVRGQIAIFNHFENIFFDNIPFILDDTYLLNEFNSLVLGATFNPKDNDTNVNESHNLLLMERLNKNLPKLDFNEIAQPQGRVGFRAHSQDRLPILGPIPVKEAYQSSYRHFQKGYALDKYPEGEVYEGLYAISGLGSKGITYASILADTLISILLQKPSPMPLDLLESLHPARFLMRDIQKRKLSQ